MPLFGPCLLISLLSLPKFVWIDYYHYSFGFQLFVRLEYTKLFDGLPGTLDMESTIVIKVRSSTALIYSVSFCYDSQFWWRSVCFLIYDCVCRFCVIGFGVTLC
ncbi:hypothetical protein RHMOL_Rhmol10G0171300 [Rhododendron molle]|uniref:Uncharacterized protein n=1 Tax=Rhododendron molle TaxID=49168 RepID=A0ACC0M495_RHOML|nr:hypothetical protein RHMOL_Rhmol10G0171300 [Rhododendron molle]